MLKLFAPESYWTSPNVEEVTGGCGPGWFGDWLVPDTIWFLNIRASCRIHDWMYYEAVCEADKVRADRVFLNNMLRQIEGGCSWKWLSFLRRIRANIYYKAVRDFGGPTFWNDKNNPVEFRAA